MQMTAVKSREIQISRLNRWPDIVLEPIFSKKYLCHSLKASYFWLHESIQGFDLGDFFAPFIKFVQCFLLVLRH